MLIQKAGIPGGTVPPPGFATPSWDSLAKQWDESPRPYRSTVTLGPTKLSLGHDDPEDLDEDPELRTSFEDLEYGWDNEHPKREVEVKEFRIEWRPVTNGEFYKFYISGGNDIVSNPASWIVDDGEFKVNITLTTYKRVNLNRLIGPYTLWTRFYENCAALASAYIL